MRSQPQFRLLCAARAMCLVLLVVALTSALPTPACAHPLTVRLRDAITSAPTAARVQIVGPNGALFEDPDPVLRTFHGGGLAGYVLAEDSFVVAVPPGTYDIRVVQGLSGIPTHAAVTVSADTVVAIPVARWVDPRADGWIGADTHVHLLHTPSEYAVTTLPEAARAARAEALDIMFLLHNDAAHPGGAVSPPEPGTSLAWGEEYRTGFWGHMVALGLSQLMDVGYGPGCCGAGQPAWPTIDAALAQSTVPLALLAHPHTTDQLVGSLFWPDSGYGRELAALALGARLNGIAVGSGSNNPGHWALTEYADGLAVGARWAAVGESDATLDRHTSGPPGWPRTYAQITNPPPNGSTALPALWEQAVRDRRCYSTDGPVVQRFEINGHAMGATASLAGPGPLSVTLRAASYAPLRAAILHGVGGARWSVAWPAGRSAIDTSFTILATSSDVLFLELQASGGLWWAPQATLRAVTSPVWIDMGALPTPPAVPAATARRAVEELHEYWQASLDEHGYATAQDSLAARNYLFGAASIYEAMVDDAPGPFALLFPTLGDTLPSAIANLRWRAAPSYDLEPTTYRVVMDATAAFLTPVWTPAAPDTFRAIASLQPGQEVFWKVVASEPGDPPRESDPPVGHFVVSMSPVGAPPAPIEGMAGGAGGPWIRLLQNGARTGDGTVGMTLQLARAARVGLRWIDLRGRVLREEPALDLAAGSHSLRWDGRDAQGRRVAAGVYWLLATSDQHRVVARALLLAR